MDETEHMPRYTLTLVDSTGAMEPLILMDDDLKSIAAKLEGRVSAKTRGRLPRGTGGISATPKGYRAYSTVTDPLTGKDHRVSGFGRTRSQAEARLKEKLAEFDRTHRVGYVRPPTVAEWMDHWLTDVCKPRLKPRTWGTYASVIANNIVPSIGAVRLDELKPAHFRRMERYVMDEQGKSSGTAGSAWRTLHKALEDAVLEGVIERNPAVKGTAPRVALKERAALTPDQAADLIAAETDDAWRLMWMLAFMTGMRQGERLGLTEDELRRDGGRLIILVEWQAQHLTKREVEGLPLTGSVERRRWYRALDRVGLGHEYVPHSARHTTATILNRLGLDDVTRTAIMGHSRVSTTNEIYTHVELDRLVAATDGVERAIEG